MTTDRWMRASDQDRENAVDVLRDAYAVGRLVPEEFYQRLGQAYAATTWGELDRLAADLPLIGTGVGLPSDTVASRDSPRTVGWFLVYHAIWVFLFVLAAGLAGRVTSVAVWAACVLVPLVLLLPLVLGRAGATLRLQHRGRPARRDQGPPSRELRGRWLPGQPAKPRGRRCRPGPPRHHDAALIWRTFQRRHRKFRQIYITLRKIYRTAT